MAFVFIFSLNIGYVTSVIVVVVRGRWSSARIITFPYTVQKNSIYLLITGQKKTEGRFNEEEDKLTLVSASSVLAPFSNESIIMRQKNGNARVIYPVICVKEVV